MRVLLMDRDGSKILTVIESVYFDNIDFELRLFEFGSSEADYVFGMDALDAEKIMSSMYENGFCDLSYYRVDKTAFDDDYWIGEGDL